MLQYLVILLDDTSVAYCHANNLLTEHNLIPLETLKKAIFFGMKENLMIQYVLPDYELPQEYYETMESIDNVKILAVQAFLLAKHATQENDVVVYDNIPEKVEAQNIVIRLSFSEMVNKRHDITALFSKITRLNLVVTDIDKFSDKEIDAYKQTLNEWVKGLLVQFKQGKQPQVNVLTDRLQLDKMHNCEAGVGNITIAPNGKFYLCPAFYYDEQMGVNNRLNHYNPSSEQSVGDLDNGLQISNPQLLKLDHAPLCRICDAYQCRRCIWLNQRLTWDNNTPSHQQCILAHLERNASRDLQMHLQQEGFRKNEIKEIDYLDPFDVRNNINKLSQRQ